MLGRIFPVSLAAVSSATRAAELHGKSISEEFTGWSQSAAGIGIVELKTYGRGAECEAGKMACGLKERTTIFTSSINTCGHRQEVTYMVLEHKGS